MNAGFTGLTLSAAGALSRVRVARSGAGFRFEMMDASSPAPTDTHLLLPGFTDAHVHLGLADRSALIGSAIGHVIDLGWDPALSLAWRDEPRLTIEVAGPFLTAPGGYPSDREWMPRAGVIELASASEAETSIALLAGLGCAVIKIASNSTAGPVLDDTVLTAAVAAAHARGLPVIAHAEGAGEAMRVMEAGVDALAHTPFTEVLNDHELEAMARSCSWISTLDIHGWGNGSESFDVALRNLRGFAAHGGRVRYGTDLGNGPLPAGLNARELAALAGAGLSGAAVLGTLLEARSFEWSPVVNVLPLAALDDPALIPGVRTFTADTIGHDATELQELP